MKKIVLFACLVFVSSFSLGCTISPPSEWCRRGSLWPFNKPAQEAQPMPTYMSSPQMVYSPVPNCCDPCATMDPCSGMGGTPYTTTPDAGNF